MKSVLITFVLFLSLAAVAQEQPKIEPAPGESKGPSGAPLDVDTDALANEYFGNCPTCPASQNQAHGKVTDTTNNLTPAQVQQGSGTSK
jgi:hypothetical protein